MRKAFAVIASAAVLAAALTSCSSNGDEASPTPSSSDSDTTGFAAESDASAPSGGVLTVAMPTDSTEANGYDPATADRSRTWTMLSLVYETLTTVDENFEPQAGLAASWEQTSDTEYVFQLRDDAVFSNGRAVTAEDVAGSLNRMRAAGGSWASQLSSVTAVTATGEHEVTITLSTAYTPLLSALAHPDTGILPMEELEAGTFDPTTEMLGSGPLVLAEHVQDQGWTFDINEENPLADELGFSELDIQILPDEATRIAALRDGSVDFALLDDADSLTQLSDEEDVATIAQANSDFTFLMLNAKDESRVTADADIRQAINAAVDRQQIIDVALGGYGVVTGVTPAILPGSCSAEDSLTLDMTDEEITEALDGLELDLLVRTSVPSEVTTGQVIQQQLSAYGAVVNLEQVDSGTFTERVYRTDPSSFDIGLASYAGYVDPSSVTTWWDIAGSKIADNYAIDDLDIDELIQTAQTLENGDERTETFESLCAAVNEQSMMVPLTSRTSFFAYRTDQLSPTVKAADGFGNVLQNIVEFRAAQ